MISSKKNNTLWEKNSRLIIWKKRPSKIFSPNKNSFSWYEDGLTNISYNCLDNNIKLGKGNKTAIYFINSIGSIESISYYKLLDCVEKFVKIILDLKINKKKYIVIHSCASLESAISMLACCRLGIPHCVLFEDLEFEAIKSRVDLLKPSLIISRSNEETINKKFKSITKKLKILSFSNYHIKSKDFIKVHLSKLIEKNVMSKSKQVNFVKSNTKSFALFTSGSTGVPKGIEHSTGGYLTYAKYTCIKQFGMNANSVSLTASDAGWINGHTYALYGPLSIGATTVLVEKPFLLLNSKILSLLLNKLKINILYLPVTLIRLMKATQPKFQKFKYLKTLGSMGETLSAPVAEWYSKNFLKKNNCIINTFFQTETGGILFSPRFNDKISNTPHGSVGKACFKTLKLNKHKKKGSFVIKVKPSWPGCMISSVNGNKVFNKYWNKDKSFNLFDIGELDNNSNLIVHGRSDDVINISGHRIGSSEIEAIVQKLDFISEVCAVSISDVEDLAGSNLFLFVSLKKKKSEKKINDILTSNFGNYAIPKKIFYLTQLPKTRSGKILRRVIRNIMINPKSKNIGDTSTILDKSIITELRDKISSYKNLFE